LLRTARTQLTFLFAVITVFGSVFLQAPAVKAQATNNVQVDLRVEEWITDTSSTLQLKVFITNKQSVKAVTSMVIPNLWDAVSLDTLSASTATSAKVKISETDILMDFDSTPVLPGGTTEYILSLKGKGYPLQNNIRRFTAGELRSADPLVSFKGIGYKLNYPMAWGDPDYISLKPENYTLGGYTLETKGIYKFQLGWVEPQIYTLGFSLPSNQNYTLLGRETASQALLETGTIPGSSIVKDRYGNIYLYRDLPTETNYQTTFVSLPNQLTRSGDTILEDDYKGLDTATVSYINSLHGSLTKRADIGEAITVISEAINTQRIILPVDNNPNSYSYENNGLPYVDYLNTLSTVLYRWGFPVKIVWQLAASENSNAIQVLEYCTDQCLYYNPAPVVQPFEQRLVVPDGFQLYAAPVLNSNDRKILVDFSIAKSQVASTGLQPETPAKNDEVSITMSTLADALTFTALPITIGVENNTNRYVFLESLEVLGQDFSVVEGNGKITSTGIAPHTKKDFVFENYKLGIWFASASKEVTLPIKLQYTIAGKPSVYEQSFGLVARHNGIVTSAVIALIIFFVLLILQAIHFFRHEYFQILKAVYILKKNISVGLTKIRKSITVKYKWRKS